MASSTQIEARNDNVNEDSIAEDIQPRVSSRYSEEVDEIHKKYIDAVYDLFNQYNPKYGDDKVKLLID